MKQKKATLKTARKKTARWKKNMLLVKKN